MPRLVEFSPRFAPNPVIVEGDGRPTLFLHGLEGPQWFPALAALARTRRIVVPSVVGCADADELEHIDGILDLMTYYDDVIAALGLDDFDLIGASFGGMIAAEYAALFNRKVRRLVLIDPFGLWDDAVPVTDHLYQPPDALLSLLYRDPGGESARALSAPPVGTDPMEYMLSRMSAAAAANQFLWPIPDRGLAKRLHRVTAETLIVWGREDAMVPVAYAERFAGGIAGARLHVSERSGHSPLVDDTDAVVRVIGDFLDG